MKTAKEMAEFCIKNGTGSGTSKSWNLKHFSVVERQLGEDETVLFAFVGLYNYISATKNESNFAIAITNKRIIAGQKKVFGENVKTIQRKNLNDISKSTGVLMGILTIDTLKETFNIATGKSEINKIYEGVNKVIFEDEIKSSDNGVATLKEYKELLDMDIITQEEFDKKKHEILG